VRTRVPYLQVAGKESAAKAILQPFFVLVIAGIGHFFCVVFYMPFYLPQVFSEALKAGNCH
jgi:hypothetical protein